MSGLSALLLVLILVNVCTALQPVNILKEIPKEATTITEGYHETFTTEAPHKFETTTSEGGYETTTHIEAPPEPSTAKVETTTSAKETTAKYGTEIQPETSSTTEENGSSTAKVETTTKYETATQSQTSSTPKHSTTEEYETSTGKVETTTTAKETTTKHETATQSQTSSTPKHSTTEEYETSTGKVETTTTAKETTTKHETATQSQTSSTPKHSTTEEYETSTGKVETTTTAKETTTNHETATQPQTSSTPKHSTTEENESSTGKVETTTKYETETETTTTVPTAPSCTKPGVQPHEEDCHKYNICSLKGSLDGQLHLITKSCPKKQAFNVEYNRCSRDISSCSLDVQCAKKGSVDDALSNTSYYLCDPRLDGSGYRVFHINCASHEIYYPKFGKCFKDPNSLNIVDWNSVRDIDIVKAEMKLLKKEDKLKILKLKQEMAEKKKLEKEALKKAKQEEKMNKTKAKLEAARFVCLDEGNFPSAVTESYYIACLNKKGKLKAVSMKCDDGVNFDPDTSACTPTTDDDDSKSADED